MELISGIFMINKHKQTIGMLYCALKHLHYTRKRQKLTNTKLSKHLKTLQLRLVKDRKTMNKVKFSATQHRTSDSIIAGTH